VESILEAQHMYQVDLDWVEHSIDILETFFFFLSPPMWNEFLGAKKVTELMINFLFNQIDKGVQDFIIFN
jgi:hypothetical protein